MTRKFDQIAADSPTLFEDLIGLITLDKLDIRLVPVKAIRRSIVLGHYSGVMPDATQEAFGAFNDQGALVAAVAFGTGGNSKSLSAIIPGHNTKNGRELIRVWVHPEAPTNTASYVISKAIKQLPKEVTLIVTYADSGQKHLGIIYQALNFFYLGMTAQGTRYIDATGVEVTSRLANVYRKTHPLKYGNKTLNEIRQELNWTPVISHPKHRYAIGAGEHKKAINKILGSKSLPYPKESFNNE
jgi:adenine modification enzyme